MSLCVLVKSASGLPNVERFSKSDPMCVITLQGGEPLPVCVYEVLCTNALRCALDNSCSA